jgi:hypothetical protein
VDGGVKKEWIKTYSNTEVCLVKMKIKRMVKRLFAVASGATMLGATAMGALAADLSSYPDMFVTDGAFDGFFVVGESAASVDNLAMTDIAASMKTTSGSGSTSTSIEGDSWLVAGSGNFLELGEKVSSIEGYIDDTQLGALADGEVSNAKGTAPYEQFLYFDENTATTTFQEDNEESVGFFYKIASGGVIARYLLDFTETLDSDIDSSSVYDDIEDKTLTLLGNKYSIVTASNSSAGVKLVLMGGAASDTLLEGESKTYTVSGKEYTVELTYVDDTNLQFSVNGELTSKLADSETDVLSDGTNIGVREINYQGYAGGIHSGSFFLGADKITLESNGNAKSIKVDEETISEAQVNITSTEADGDISIDDISIRMTADDDFYVGPGQKLSEHPEMDEPQVLFTQNWDIELVDVEVVGEELVSLTFSEGDDQADLKLPLYDGTVVMSLVFDNSTSAEQLVWGEDENERFIFSGTNSITDEDFFILSTSDPDVASNDARSYLLQYKGADDDGETNPKARIKNLASGETYSRSLTNNSGPFTFDLKLGGTTFSFTSTGATASDDFDVNYTSGGASGVTKADSTAKTNATQVFRTANNHEVWIEGPMNGTSNGEEDQTVDRVVWVVVDDSDLTDDSTDVPVVVMNVTISGSASAKDLATSSGTTNTSLISDPEDSDIQYTRSFFGEKLTVTAPTSGPSKYELSIPTEQAVVKLYVTSGSTTKAMSASGGALTPVSIVVGATKLDSEIASATAQNVITVGGPCVNTVSASLMGNPADCTEGFTPGKARIKLWEHSNGNMAMLVAGYSGADTRLAGKVIAQRWAEMSGEEVEVEGTTYTDATLGAPTVAKTTTVADDTTGDAMADDTTTS